MAKTAKKDPALTPEEKLAQALVPESEQPYPIPENWYWVRLGNSSEIIMGQSPEGTSTTDDPSYMPLIGGAADMGDLFPKASRYTTNPTKIGKKNDVILCIRATLGKPIFSDGEYCLGRGVAAVRSETLIKEYLRYGLISFEQYLYDNATGTTFAQVSSTVLQKMPFPIAPLAEQHRIVDRIESLFAKLDEAKEKAQAVVDGFEDRKAAILQKAFTGELTAEWRKKQEATISEWQIKKVADIGEIITGNTPSTKHSEYYNGPIPFVKPTELNQGRYVATSAETLTEQGKAVSRPIRAGSTCICCIGATIGKCGLVAVDCVTNQQINSIVPYDYMDDVFVYYYCCSSKFKNELIANSSATTLPIINKSRTSELQFVVPSREEQHQIANILDTLFEKEQQAKETAEQVIDQIETMKKSILSRAFRGELGTNDPADESAEELLRRIL